MKILLVFLLSATLSWWFFHTLNGDSPAVPELSSAPQVEMGPADLSPKIRREIDALDTEGGSTKVFELFNALATENPHLILQIYEAFLPKVHEDERISLVLNTTGRLFRTNPWAGLKWASEQPKELQDQIYSFGIRAAVDEFSTAQVIDLVSDVPPDSVPVGSIANAITTERGIMKAIEWIEQYHEDETHAQGEIQGLIMIQANTDPHLAIELEPVIGKLPPESVAQLIEALSRTDTSKALTWIGSLDEGEAKQQAQRTILARLAEQDPSSALEHLPSDAEPELISAVALGWAMRDWNEAYEWALSQEDSDAAINTLLGASKGNADLASSLVREMLIKRPEFAESAVESTAHLTRHLFNESPSFCQSWIQSLHEGAARDSAVSSYVEQLAVIDPVATSEWLTSLEQVPDAALVPFLNQISNDLEGVLAWSAKMEDKETRMTLLTELLADWKAVDESYVNELVRASPLDEQAKEELLKP